ncbi:MAG: SAM-dependent methyltransferase [Bdellovibrionales bacterium GWA2_49_15]|nr:MAG: SAM-dependent methyltransferase [Bdellovibrionales bacterium GWA2_49_15]HAZ14924.1 SAM-dependent methyltransferase [Bdellovibrionales bacterium]
MGQAPFPEINPDQSVELLKELHILTRDGKMNQDSRRKLKQVYHLYNFIGPLLNQIHLTALEGAKNYSIIDHGAGKSYLGFILYDLFIKQKNLGEVIGIETRKELVTKSVELAQKLNFERMKFFHLTVEESISSDLLPNEVEMVTALHACDTATDDAIRFAILKKAKHVVLIPCCQAEVAATLKMHKEKSLRTLPLTELWRHPLHTREFGSHVTNVLRCLQLEAFGYQVTVTELTGLEHSMKNELIMAKLHQGPSQKAGEKVKRILADLNLHDLMGRFFVPM